MNYEFLTRSYLADQLVISNSQLIAEGARANHAARMSEPGVPGQPEVLWWTDNLDGSGPRSFSAFVVWWSRIRVGGWLAPTD